MIYNRNAIDYSQGIDIYDPDTGQYYTDSEARALSQGRRKRLIMKPRKIGCYVQTIEEIQETRKRNV